MAESIRVLFEDSDLMVFDKPAGLLVIPSPKKEKNTLDVLVNEQYTSDVGKLHPCHRLDRETSGAIIFARGKKNQQLMMQEFQQNAVKKTYVAFVLGQMKTPQGEIRKPIRDYHQKKFARHSSSKPAVTKYKVTSLKKKFSVVEAMPVTGRTNQIRIHFSEVGNPLLGERIYAFRKDFSIDFKRLALHAHKLEFIHPVKKIKVEVVSPLPQDMEEFLSRN